MLTRNNETRMMKPRQRRNPRRKDLGRRERCPKFLVRVPRCSVTVELISWKYSRKLRLVSEGTNDFVTSHLVGGGARKLSMVDVTPASSDDQRDCTYPKTFSYVVVYCTQEQTQQFRLQKIWFTGGEVSKRTLIIRDLEREALLVGLFFRRDAPHLSAVMSINHCMSSAQAV